MRHDEFGRTDLLSSGVYDVPVFMGPEHIFLFALPSLLIDRAFSFFVRLAREALLSRDLHERTRGDSSPVQEEGTFRGSLLENTWIGRKGWRGIIRHL